MMTMMTDALKNGRFELWGDEEFRIRESIRDILRTPRGSRVMRPEYGSNLHELIDRPATEAWKMNVYRETARAIKKNEPRVKLKKVSITAVDLGSYSVECVFEHATVEVTI